MPLLDPFDRQIAAALIRNGRASWRRIAAVLDEPERRVAKRGGELLRSGVVQVRGFVPPLLLAGGELTLVRVTAPPRELPAVAARMADDPRSTWVSSLGGPSSVIGEFAHDRGELADMLASLALDAVASIDARPELRFYRTVAGWSPGILTEEQLTRLRKSEDGMLAQQHAPALPDAMTAALLALLADNGRATTDELGQTLGISKSTVSRRLETAISSGLINIRAVVDPAVLGFPIESVVRIDPAPGALAAVGTRLAASASARWVIDDGVSVIAQLAHADRAALRTTLLDLHDEPRTASVRHALVLGIAKRSRVRYRDGAPERAAKH